MHHTCGDQTEPTVAPSLSNVRYAMRYRVLLAEPLGRAKCNNLHSSTFPVNLVNVRTTLSCRRFGVRTLKNQT